MVNVIVNEPLAEAFPSAIIGFVPNASLIASVPPYPLPVMVIIVPTAPQVGAGDEICC